MTDSWEIEFARRLDQLGQYCNYTMTEGLAEFYDRGLKDLGYQKACEAIDLVMRGLVPGDKFPSVAQIRKTVTGELTPSEISKADDSQARTAASLVLAAVVRFGAIVGHGAEAKAKAEEISEFVGELGWEIVQMRGGWNFICDSIKNDGLGIFEAHMRDLAKAKIERRRRGVDHAPPALPLPGERQRDLKPISGISVADLFPGQTGEILKAIEAKKK